MNEATPRTPSLDLSRERKAREEGYRAAYQHVLKITRSGVTAESVERDVGAYMADFAGPRP